MALLCFYTSLAEADCIITMRWNDDIPYTYMGKKSDIEPVGISIDIAKQALESIHCQVKLIKMPWARALIELKAGRIDLISRAFKKPERSIYANFSTFGFYSPNVLFILKSDSKKWQVKTLADLTKKDFKLGVQIGVSYGQDFDQLSKNKSFSKHLVRQSNRESLWKMLSFKRIDGVLADQTTGLLELRELGLHEEISVMPLSLSSKPAFFAFSKKTTSASFVKRFDDALRKMQNNGEIKKISQKYLGD